MNEEYTPEVLKNLTPDQIGSEVGDCIDGMKELKERVDAAVIHAKAAKQLADDANSVTLKWWKIGDKAEAIKALQKAMVDVSAAQEDQAKAVEQILKYQESVANGMRFLFRLGALNMANNRIVLKEIAMKLQGASEEDIGAMARQELISVMAQLKAQLDIQTQQERLAKDQAKVRDEVHANKESIATNAEDIRSLQSADEVQDVELRRQAEMDKVHDSKIAANAAGIERNAAHLCTIEDRLKHHRHALAEAKVGGTATKTAILLSSLALAASLLALAVAVLAWMK